MHACGFTDVKTDRRARAQSGRMVLLMLAAIWASSIGVSVFGETPAVGAKAPDFTLSTPTGKVVRMPEMRRGHDLVLVVLRGFPGYQCPYCMRQVHDFIGHACSFAAKNATILLLYPGPPADLDLRAHAFLEKEPQLPSNVVLVLDPEYSVTNLYGLRWNARNETAYPSTFILDKKGMIVFEKISHSHGDRVSALEALDHISAH
jgi:thioredoxin-dependent peroxiredoxin